MNEEEPVESVDVFQILAGNGEPGHREEILSWLKASYAAIDRAVVDRLGQHADAGYSATCRSGCSACCYDFGLTFPVEMVGIMDAIDKMPPRTLSALLDRLEVWSQIRSDAGMAPVVIDHETSKEATGEAIAAFVRFSAENNSPCAFLDDGKCSVYEARPAACRMHYAFSPAEDCHDKLIGDAEIVQPDMSPLALAWGSSLLENGFEIRWATDPSQLLLVTLALEGKNKSRRPDQVIASSGSEYPVQTIAQSARDT